MADTNFTVNLSGDTALREEVRGVFASRLDELQEVDKSAAMKDVLAEMVGVYEQSREDKARTPSVMTPLRSIRNACGLISSQATALADQVTVIEDMTRTECNETITTLRAQVSDLLAEVNDGERKYMDARKDWDAKEAAYVEQIETKDTKISDLEAKVADLEAKVEQSTKLEVIIARLDAMTGGKVGDADDGELDQAEAGEYDPSNPPNDVIPGL